MVPVSKIEEPVDESKEVADQAIQNDASSNRLREACAARNLRR